jgi:hypothetical protein
MGGGLALVNMRAEPASAEMLDQADDQDKGGRETYIRSVDSATDAIGADGDVTGL